MNDPLIGKTLKNSYLIERQLADGGMGMVYVAKQVSLDRDVVLKVLRPTFYDKAFIDLFLREARINSQLNHPNIVSVLDFGETDDQIVFLALEYLEGQSLHDIVSEKGPFNLARIVWLMEQVCNGVFAAHQLDVVHRDLKPNNIMVAKLSGDTTVAKVLDFGISKPLKEEDLEHTQLGMVMGTPGYLSPEQIEGSALDVRADIYALGALLYFISTGKRPFTGASREIMMRQQLTGENPELTPDNCPFEENLVLNPVIKKAMSVDRNQRYQDVKSLWQDILLHAQAHHKLHRGDTDPDPTQVANTIFQIVFKGELLEGQSKEEAKEKLFSVLKLKPAHTEVLFSGKRIIVRKGLNKKDADRFLKVFHSAGTKAYCELQNEATQILSNPGAFTDSLAQFNLPTAGLVQPVTLSDMPKRAAIDTRMDSGSASDSTINGDDAGVPRAQPRKRLRLLSALICILIVVVGSGYFYKPIRYQVLDLWMMQVNGYQEPQGISVGEIRIGMSAAFSGSARELGRSMQLGVEAYFKKLNDQGGIEGRQLLLDALDDGYEPTKAVGNLDSFFDDVSGVFALLGNVGTPTAAVIIPRAFEEKMVVFGTFSGARLLRNDPPDRFVFNYRASYAEETEAIIKYFVDIKKHSPNSIAVFYQNDGFGKDGFSGVVSALAHYDIDPSTIKQGSYERNSTNIIDGIDDLVPHIEKIKAFVVVGTYAASAEFTKAVKLIGFIGDIANVSFVGTHALAETLLESETDIGDGIIVTQTVPLYSSNSSLVIDYREALKKYSPSETPDFISLEGYIAAKIFCEGLQRAGRYVTTESLIDALETIQNLDLGIGSELSFNKSNHQASHRVWGTLIQAGGSIIDLDLNH